MPVAWLLATGVQWDFVQVCGWGRMFAGYSQIMPWTKAVRMTFNGEMCGVCRAVDAAAEQRADSGAVPTGDTLRIKITLICESPRVLLVGVPGKKNRFAADPRVPENLREAPPTPPPRLMVA